MHLAFGLLQGILRFIGSLGVLRVLLGIARLVRQISLVLGLILRGGNFFRLVALRLVALRLIALRLIALRLITLRLITLRLITLRLITLRLIALRLITLDCRLIAFRLTLRLITLRLIAFRLAGVFFGLFLAGGFGGVQLQILLILDDFADVFAQLLQGFLLFRSGFKFLNFLCNLLLGFFQGINGGLLGVGAFSA